MRSPEKTANGASQFEATPGPVAQERRWRAPTFAAGAVIFASIAAKSMAERLSENDLWWHLRTGKLILSHGLPHTDPYSYTVHGKPWIVQSWAAEVILRAIRALFGLRGIIVWRTVMLLMLYAVVAKLFIRERGNNLATWTLVAITAYAGSQHWIERPSLFSLVFFALVLYLATGHQRNVWLCVPIFAVWANVHAVVVLGLWLLILLAVLEWFNVLLDNEHVNRAWARTLSLVAIASVVATFANPYGPRLLTFSLGLVHTVSGTAAEWGSPDFHQGAPLLFLILVAAAIGALAFAHVRPDPGEVLLLIAFFVLTLVYQRNLPFSAIVVGYVVARTTPHAVRGSPHPETARAVATERVLAASLVAGAIVLLTFFVAYHWPPSGKLRDVANPAYPVTTISKIPNGPVRLFTEDRWAGLAIYMRWPQVRVAFDGRGDLYGAQLIDQYRKTISGAPGWQQWLDETCTTHVLIDIYSGLTEPIARDPGWRRLRSDPIEGGRARLYVRRSLPARCTGVARLGAT